MESAVKRTFASFSIYNFRLFMFGQSLSLCGTWIQVVAVAWLVLDLTHSGTQLGLVTAAQFLPMLLFGVWGGVIADRFDKRRIQYVTQTIAGLVALTLGLLVVTHTVHMWMVYVLMAILGLSTVVDNPTRQTFVSEMVGPSYLKNAVTLNSTVTNMARIVGPSFAGILIATVGVGPCFLINAGSFIAVLIALKLIRSSELHRSQRLTSARGGQIKEGLSYVLKTPVLRSTLLMMFIMGIFTYEFPVVLPLLARNTLHGDAATYSAMSSALGVGAVIGGLFSAGTAAVGQRRLIKVAIAFGICDLILAIAPTLVTALLVLVAVGVFSVLFITLGNTTLQLTSAPQLRGRVMSLWAIGFFGTTPIGGPIIGFISDHTNPRVGLAVGGIGALVAAGFGMLAMKYPRSQTD